MDEYAGAGASQRAHLVEIYTSALLIQGTLYGPFERTSDLVNRWDRSNLVVRDAALAPLGRASNPKRVAEPLFVPRDQIHFITVPRPLPSETNYDSPDRPMTDPSLSTTSLRLRLGGTGDKPASQQGFGVPRVAKPCHVFTSVFTVAGLCYLVEGTTIETILDMQAPFFALTDTSIHLNLYPDSPWHRPLALMSKALLQAVYTTEQPSPPQQPQNPPQSPQSS